MRVAFILLFAGALGAQTKESMKRPFAATVWREGNWYVSQCLEVDIASQGETEEEALELYFEHPRPS